MSSRELPGKDFYLQREVVIPNKLSERHIRFFAQGKLHGSC
jgi:hypothetical protein